MIDSHLTILTCTPLLQTLNILETFDLRAMGHGSADYVHVLVEAMKLAYADRDSYYADPEFVKVPAKGLLSKDYAKVRAKLIDMAHASEVLRGGDPVAFDPDVDEWPFWVAVCWFSVKMTARLDVNATPGVRMSPLAPGIVPECSGASRVKRAARAGFAALDSPCALWYSLVVGERERSGAPGIRVFMRAPCYYAAHAAPLVPAPVSGPAPTRSLGPCQP